MAKRWDDSISIAEKAEESKSHQTKFKIQSISKCDSIFLEASLYGSLAVLKRKKKTTTRNSIFSEFFFIVFVASQNTKSKPPSDL